ncbi:MAG: sulfatase [Gemmataceae bacterium]
MRFPLLNLFVFFLPLFVVVLAPICGQAANQKEPVNFVFCLVDDLGWADVGCNGSTFYETPNIDKLAGSGMRFTNGYTASPVCSPTRASIMSGKHPVRVNITDWIPGQRGRPNNRLLMPEDRSNLALSEVTIAEALKMAGYQTFFAGKWHLGSKGHWPTDQGFDTNIGGWEAGSPKKGGYYSPWTNPNLKSKKKGEYLTERLTQESINFLEKRDKKKPFLLYLAYYNVHTPIQAYKKRVGHYQDKAKELNGQTPYKKEHEGFSRGRQDNPSYASMVAAVDDSVGQILAKLQELELDDNTVVLFFSDNGGLCTVGGRRGPTCNLPLRSGKGWLYEGGIRVPMIIRAPGTTRPGSVCHYPAVSMDFYPTMLELAGLKARPKQHVDGVSLVPLLKGKSKLQRQTLYWHYPHYHGSTWKPGSSLRHGDWVLIRFDHHDKVELYDLKNDPSQTLNLAQKMPKKADELLKKLAAWQKDIGAKLPRPNPAYDPNQRNPGKRKRKKQEIRQVSLPLAQQALWKNHVFRQGFRRLLQQEATEGRSLAEPGTEDWFPW